MQILAKKTVFVQELFILFVWYGPILLYKPLKLKIRHFLSKWTATPVGVDRTMFPWHSIRLSAPVSSLIFLLGIVRSILNLVPWENGCGVYINTSEADIFRVLSSNTCFLSKLIVSTLEGSVRGNLWYRRCSSISNTFYILPLRHQDTKGE